MGGVKEKRHVQKRESKLKVHYWSENFDSLQRSRSFVDPGQLQNSDHQEFSQYKRRSGIMTKPAMELYKPPTMRQSDGYEGSGGEVFGGLKSAYDMFYPKERAPAHRKRVSLNINAKEFQPEKRHGQLQHSKSGANLKLPKTPVDSSLSTNRETKSISTTRVKFDLSGFGESHGPTTGVGPLAIKRSKSLGSVDMLCLINGAKQESTNCLDSFPTDQHKILSAALTDPNQLSARQLMEVVRHVFGHVTEASKNAEPSARLCATLIQRENNETFLETLLNTCQEYYQERDRLLRGSADGGPRGAPSTHPKWIAFMKFLNELYTQLKRHHGHLMTNRMKNGGTPAGVLLLTLISQCCCVCLQKSYVNSLSEVECLFFVLTTVGKDIETKLPQQMELVISVARDALFAGARVASVRKTLLQIIEMHAAKWQLPAQAVMYYYPGSCAKIAADA